MKGTVCFFNSNRAWGGGEKWHLTSAEDFRARGFDVLVVANEGSKLAAEARRRGVPVSEVSVGNLSFLNPVKLLSLTKFFREKKVDTVILNLPSDLKLAGIAAKRAGVRNIIYRRGMPHPLRNTGLNRYLFTDVLTGIVVNSEEIGRSLRRGNEGWFPERKLVLVYNGVDSSVTPSRSAPLYRKARGEIVIGNAGRLTEQKGQTYLIEMASLLHAQGLNFKLLIAGEGELLGPLREKINGANLQDRIQLLGHVSDMGAFFGSLDVFVFPSLYEGSANTLIETLQHGVPAVAFEVSSNPEILVHRKNGLLAKPFDVRELADLVRELCLNPELGKTFNEESQRMLRDKFDSRKNLGRLVAVIEAGPKPT